MNPVTNVVVPKVTRLLTCFRMEADFIRVAIRRLVLMPTAVIIEPT